MFNNSANSANAALFAQQANIMLAACNAQAVPLPPISYNSISDCVNTVRAGSCADCCTAVALHCEDLVMGS